MPGTMLSTFQALSGLILTIILMNEIIMTVFRLRNQRQKCNSSQIMLVSSRAGLWAQVYVVAGPELLISITYCLSS